ncbi:MAG: glutamate--tRNA ligase [Bacteroidetes bacterium]|nr:glutamate--tRNA ligase [Bacteroidota bacterium]MBL7105427.1 glutamate--tRNA ligase [Bacteroidales bacterium]
MNTKEIRVRFAPSPTGPLHIGGVRTALYNYLFARNHGGKFILRIEDTDQNRFVPGAEDYILESLEWCGIEFDEGIHKGGPYAPYRQSERKEIYREYAEKLIETGDAYYAFDTPEELDALRKKLEREKAVNTSYSSLSRKEMKNSLTLTEEEVQSKIESGDDYVIRFKMPENEETRFQDIIRGEVIVNSSTLDDKVLFKSDGMPTYHLANIVDDHLMEITYVIRGEEWLPSLPLHVLLYKAFGWKSPQFAHMPLTLKPDGKGKLSKRDGDRLGFPVFPLEWKNPQTGEVSSGYRESGYIPEAFINILAFLGWNPGTEQEIFSMKELIEAFSLERVGKAGSRFNPEKAKWYNHQYLIQKSDKELAKLYQLVLKEKGIDASDDYVAKVVGIIKERANFVKDFWDQSDFFFESPKEYDRKMVKKRWKENTPEILNSVCKELEIITEFTSENLEVKIKEFLEKNELGMGQVMTALRLTIVGSGRGPGMFDIMELLGKEEVISRIEVGLQKIRNLFR